VDSRERDEIGKENQTNTILILINLGGRGSCIHLDYNL